MAWQQAGSSRAPFRPSPTPQVATPQYAVRAVQPAQAPAATHAAPPASSPVSSVPPAALPTGPAPPSTSADAGIPAATAVRASRWSSSGSLVAKLVAQPLPTPTKPSVLSSKPIAAAPPSKAAGKPLQPEGSATAARRHEPRPPKAAAAEPTVVTVAPPPPKPSYPVPVWPALKSSDALSSAALAPPAPRPSTSPASAPSPTVAPAPPSLTVGETGSTASSSQKKREVKESQREQLRALEDSQRMEVEALQSIHLTDLTILASVPALNPSSPPLPSQLSLTILPEPLLDREKANHAVLSLLLSYPPLSVPLQRPQVTVSAVKGLDAELMSEVSALVEREMARLWADDVGHDGVLVSLCSSVQEWLRAHNVESFSFYEEMKRREQREADDAERQRAIEQQQAEREERERKERLAAEIAEVNKRKERMTAKAIQQETAARLNRTTSVTTTAKLSHICPSVSPLPTVALVKRASSEDIREGEGRKGAQGPSVSPVVDARGEKAKRAKERQLEKRQQQQRREHERRGKRANRADGDEDLSTSNPVQTLADSGADDSDDDDDGSGSSSSDSASADEAKEDSDAEGAAAAAFASPSPGSGGLLSFFSQKQKNEKHLLAQLDRRLPVHDSDAEHSHSDLDDDSDPDPVSPSPAIKRPAVRSPKKPSTTPKPPPSKAAAPPPGPIALPPSTTYSRYRTDFEELELLGRGGFGEVYKVRHRVDKLLYAVKRIRLRRRGGNVNRRIVREVSTIGMLHHTFIVRYYGAWLEDEDDEDSRGNSGRRRAVWRLEEDAEGDSDWLSSSNFHGSLDADEDDSDDDAAPGSNHSSRRSSESSAGHQWTSLYIQMEYVPNRTLKDIIADRLCERNMEACWRLFRQTLEAVAYIHSKDIVHRDLKPANIFIDHQLSVRLGDFGLAVLMAAKNRTAAAHEQKEASAESDPIAQSDKDEGGPSAESGSLREVVGTVFYRSPEQGTEGVAYDEKCDIYALGIIMFELFTPFNSAMERAHVLTELRRTHTVPADFMLWTDALAAERRTAAGGDKKTEKEREREREKEKERREERRVEREKVASIIHQLIAPNTALRPSASSLLKSGLIPIKIEDEYLELSLKLLSHRDSPYHAQLLSMLFGAPVDALTEYTYDYLAAEASAAHVMRGGEGGTAVMSPLPLSSYHLFQQRVFDVAVHHFRLHGAALFSTPLVMPKSTHALLEEQHSQVMLLDESGILLKLPYTLTIPFARYVAQSAALDESARPSPSSDAAWSRNGLRVGHGELLSMDWRRFDLAKVYRKNPVGGRPRSVYECDFDVVWPNPTASTSATAAASTSSPTEGRKEVEAYHKERRVAFVAEAIKLTLDIVSHFSYALGPVLVRVNHHRLVDAVLQCVLPAPGSPQYGEFVGLLYRLSSHFSLLSSPFARSAFRKTLLKEKKLSERQVDWLGSCLTLRADHTQLDAAFARTRELLQSAPANPLASASQRVKDSSLSTVEEALAELRSLYELLKALGVAEYAVFDLGLTGRRELYGGALTFQAFMHAKAAPSDARQQSVPTSPAVSSSTSVTLDPIAVGGCYDRLLAQLMPPSATTTMSGVGVNLAVEKILHAIVDCHLHTRESRTFPPFSAFFASSSLHAAATTAVGGKGKKGKRGSVVGAVPSSLFSLPSTSPPPTTFLPPPLPGIGAPVATVLLYSPKAHLLRERVSLASLLWTEQFVCLYSTPLSLSLSLLFSFLRLHSVRFLVLMRRRQWKERGVVELIDMDAVPNQRRWDRTVTRIKGGEKESKRQPADDDDQRERDKDGIDVVLISEILATLRNRAANIRRDDADTLIVPSHLHSVSGAGSAAASGSSASATATHSTGHPHPHPHAHPSSSAAGTSAGSGMASSSVHIQLIDPASSIKRDLKPNILTAARRAISPMCTAQMKRTAVALAIDAPIAQLRGLGTAYMTERGGKRAGGGGREVDAVMEYVSGVQSRWRTALEAAWEHVLKRMSEGAVEYAFLYSISDRKVDMFML